MEGVRQVRFEWKGAAISDELRSAAEQQARPLTDCGRMRALTIERRTQGLRSEYRVCCRCADRGSCIVAGRLGLGLAIEAFRAAQRSRCLKHERR
jgi:hypothetical protein